MSVLIRGMEMPKSCDVCCFDLFVESCPLYNATPEDLVGITWIKKARHRYCPLVSVPPHGRLIDADAPIPLVDTHGKKIEVTVAHIIEENFGVVNAIIEAEEDEHDV